MKLYCDNKSTINIAHNPIQHNKTKHIEIDILSKTLESGLIYTPYVSSKNQLENVLTKRLDRTSFQKTLLQLIEYIYSPF